MEFLVHAAICEEKTKVMLLPVKSKNINEIVVAGRGIELAEKITDVCKSQRANLIITSKVYENLKSRVIIDRVYKLKEENEEIKLYQVRL
jgi:class 3 adenylate cyclase